MKRTIAIIFAAACLMLGCTETTITADNGHGQTTKPSNPNNPSNPSNPNNPNNPNNPGNPSNPNTPTTPTTPVDPSVCKGIDMQTSIEHCGTCGNACGTNQICTGGKCGCIAGYSDCDNSGTCETEGECECHPGDTIPCYTGPAGTEKVGNCHGGTRQCEVDEDLGAAWSYECIGEVTPNLFAICDSANPYGDSDCNGQPDYLQDEDEDGFTVCTEFGTTNDCCDSTFVCSSPGKLNPGKTADCKGNNLDDDCDGEIDEDDIPCTGSTTAESCLMADRKCGDTLQESIYDDSWQYYVASGNAALMLAQSMDLCMETVTKESNKPGILEYSLSKSSSAGPSKYGIGSAQAAVMNGMANSSGAVLIPPRVGNNFAMISSGTAGDSRNVGIGESIFGGQDAVPNVYLAQHGNQLLSHPSCSGSSPNINDSVVLHLKLRAPETAKGFSFDFRFFSREYPYYVCTSYNDFFMTIVTDESGKPFIDTNNDGTATDEDGNISFDKLNHAVSVNNAFFTTCAAPACYDSVAMSNIPNAGCPASSTCNTGHCGSCEDGFNELYAYYPDPYTGSGNGRTHRGGGTAWLTTQAPVAPGQIFNIDFYIWDTGDSNYDSSVILDNFQWRCDETPVGTDFADPDPNKPIN